MIAIALACGSHPVGFEGGIISKEAEVDDPPANSSAERTVSEAGFVKRVPDAEDADDKV